jgi:hypothetical protein
MGRTLSYSRFPILQKFEAREVWRVEAYCLATKLYVIVAEFGQGPQLLLSRLLIGNYGGLKAGRAAQHAHEMGTLRPRKRSQKHLPTHGCDSNSKSVSRSRATS